MKKFSSISDFTDPGAMEALTGPVAAIRETMLSGVGFSGSVLHRLEIEMISGLKESFILKQTNLNTEWLSQRTSDSTGREAAILGAESLSDIWKHIHCPYIAYAMEDGEIAVLMNDLSPYLFPDVKEPIEPEIEKAILNTLASLHAAFWESSELKKISWLAQPARYLETFSPGIHPTDLFAQPPEKLAATITQGWELALGLLPKDIRSVFLQPSEKILKHWESLPATLLHGDVKIANMAHMPGGRIAAFDWAFAGHGPCSIDLGWYISVNSSRLAQSKEEVIATYRAFLEDYLPHPIDEKTWKEIVDLAVFTGARMLLWNKALGYNAGTEKGIKEWDWWLQNLEIVTKHMSDAK